MSENVLRGRRVFSRLWNGLDFEGRKIRAEFDNLKKRYFKHYWEQVAYGIDAEIEDIGYGFFRIRKNGKFLYVNHYKVSLDDHLSLNLAMIKPLMHRLLAEAGYRVPRYHEYDINSIDQAYKFLNSLDGTAVVKPVRGWAGGGVVTGISDLNSLRKASFTAAMFDSRIFIEEEVNSNSYRLLYLDGVLIDAVRRDKPALIGNGESTIRELIKKENETRLTNGKVTALSPLAIDDECKNKLAEQGRKTSDIPDNGTEIIVKNVVNQNSAKENHIVRGEVHPYFNQLGKQLSSILDLKLIGLDIMATSLTIPLDESGGVINEINGTPGLQHHDLVAESEEKARVGERIIEFVLR